MEWHNLPAEHTQNKVEHEEGADNDERHKVDPVEGCADSVVGLGQQQQSWVEVYPQCLTG